MRSRTYELVYAAIFAVLLAICSWISIPTVIPFTLQTFGVFSALFILGGRRGTIAISIFLLLGVIGIPVFSNFGAGLGVLLGNTGGYAIGFLFIGLSTWLFEKFFPQKTILQILSMLLGLLFCYAFGTFWFMNISMNSDGTYELMTVLTMCVFPFIIPDLIKLWFAYLVSRRIRPLLKIWS